MIYATKNAFLKIEEGAIPNQPSVSNTLSSVLMLPSKLSREGMYICGGKGRHCDTQSAQ